MLAVSLLVCILFVAMATKLHKFENATDISGLNGEADKINHRILTTAILGYHFPLDSKWDIKL